MQVLHHYAEGLEASVTGDISALDASPFLRRRWNDKRYQRFVPTVRPSAVCAGGEGCEHTPVCRRAQVVPSADMVPSRGRSVPPRHEDGEEDSSDDGEDDGGGRSPAGDLCPARGGRRARGSVPTSEARASAPAGTSQTAPLPEPVAATPV